MRKAIAAAMLLSLAILPQVAKADVFLADFTLLPATRLQVLRSARVAAELQLKGLTPGTGDVWLSLIHI